MQVQFANGTLAKCANDLRRAKKKWRTAGVAEAYVEKIQVLMAIEELDQLYQFRGFNFHALHGQRRGQYAITLSGLWRLIIVCTADEEEILVVEVKDYHD